MELRNNQKWCELSYSAKRRKCEDGSQSSTSHENETKSEHDRPPGVKAAKSKKTKIELKALIEFQSMWDKRQDLAMK